MSKQSSLSFLIPLTKQKEKLFMVIIKIAKQFNSKNKEEDAKR